MESCEPVDEEELPSFSLGMEFLTPPKKWKEKENKEQAWLVSSHFATLSESKLENININVIKQLVHMSAVHSLRYDMKHLGSLESTQEVASSNSYAFLFSPNFLRASYLDEHMLTYEPIVKW